jgi:ubiquinone/menaquinone biosynthesis C-methylase UbiE
MNEGANKTAEYYDQIAKTYDENGYSESDRYYPGNLYRLELAKNILAEIPSGKILDAGCGTGQLLAYLAEKGYECSGCDISKNMLDQAGENVSKVTSKQVQLVQTSLDDLSMFEDHYFDHIFCLGVFPYITEDQEGACYKELHRIIKPGGLFVTAHENEIFDTFTFNKYTLRFFENNVYPLLGEVAEDIDASELTSSLAGLITNPDKPVNVDPKKSGRDIIFTKPENPITYGDKLSSYGFKNCEILYYHFHALPPLLRNDKSKLLALSKKMEIRFAKEWQGMFLASTFISVARACEGVNK